jgi:mono/diheme cytochrome c family protein
MADEKQSGQELKGLVLAVVAGVLVVALAFGVSAIMRHVMPAPVPSASTPAPTNEPNTPVPGGPSQSLTAQMISTGGQYYKESCASCHGPTGAGVIGPSLRNLTMPDSRVAGVIKNGKGEMPPFGKQYSDSQIMDIVGYLHTLK